jgi:putative transposase
VVTNQRRSILTEPGARNILREAFIETRSELPFKMDAICLLPEHLHCIWTLPEQDHDFSTRWKRSNPFLARSGYKQEGNPEK